MAQDTLVAVREEPATRHFEAIAVILLFVKPVYSVSGLFIVLLGMPVYFIWRSRSTRSA